MASNSWYQSLTFNSFLLYFIVDLEIILTKKIRLRKKIGINRRNYIMFRGNNQELFSFPLRYLSEEQGRIGCNFALNFHQHP